MYITEAVKNIFALDILRRLRFYLLDNLQKIKGTLRFKMA